MENVHNDFIAYNFIPNGFTNNSTNFCVADKIMRIKTFKNTKVVGSFFQLHL